MTFKDVDINDITVPLDRRKTSLAKVKEIANSITAIGLLHPVGLNADLRLIYGRHRLDAFTLLGRSTIPAMIHSFDDLHARLAEIDENILRKNLNAAEEAKALSNRKHIYEALHPETKQGATLKKGPKRQNVATGEPSFADDTATKTGQSKRTVERKVEVGEKLSDEVVKLIADSPIADNQSELKLLADMDESEQLEVAAGIASGEITSLKKTKKAKATAAAEDKNNKQFDALKEEARLICVAYPKAKVAKFVQHLAAFVNASKDKTIAFIKLENLAEIIAH
jgi:ParB family transcriptional regulator, chromosome partitioning protein